MPIIENQNVLDSCVGLLSPFLPPPLQLLSVCCRGQFLHVARSEDISHNAALMSSKFMLNKWPRVTSWTRIISCRRVATVLECVFVSFTLFGLGEGCHVLDRRCIAHLVPRVNHCVSNSMNVLKRVSAICVLLPFSSQVAGVVTARRQQASPSPFKPQPAVTSLTPSREPDQAGNLKLTELLI